MKIREEIIEQGKYYHIFNRGVNSKIVFLNNENYKFFLLKVDKYIIPYIDVISYCLMANHFHFILRAKEHIEFQEIKFKEKGLHSEDAIFSKSIGKLISSYTQAFNKTYQRSGALFESPFKRIHVDSEKYLRDLILYVHQNPENFENYKYSSYKAIISDAETKIKRNEVLEIFGDKENFIFMHRNNKIEIL